TNSALNAKPFSINGLDIPQAAYAQSRFSLIMGGPLVVKHIVKDPNTQFFFTYFGTRSRTPRLFTETVPTSAERVGDFSQATQSLGTSATSVPVAIFDPTTHIQFPANVIPARLLNPASLRLLQFYPVPNEPGTANNYQFETAAPNNTDNLGLRVQRNITQKDRLAFNFQYQNRDGRTPQWYGVSDSTSGYGLSGQIQWTRNISAQAISNAQVRISRNRTEITPYFSLVPDVAAQIGIYRPSSSPLDYGPPTLTFTNFAGLTDSTATLTRNQTQSFGESVTLLKGLHSITLGMNFTRADLSTRSDPNGRGTLSFNGLLTSDLTRGTQPVPGTGYDLADFLLGDPQSSSIRYGDTSNYFSENQWFGYAQDEWKMRPNLTVVLGLRYEFFTPYAEKYGHMANLDIAPGFTNVSLATPAAPGAYTGVFPAGLINPDHNNFSPRVGLAWKLPWTKRSTLLRTGYGIYYNEQSYIQLAQQLAQQPPFAKSYAVNTTLSNPLTLNAPFSLVLPQSITNTFAVDRYYRTPYAHTWNFSIQHDFAHGYFVEAGYVGTKGTHLDVRTLPNEPPPGSPQLLTQRNQLGDAVGFTYDLPVGNSIFNALQLRAVRRFNRGISFNAFYQLAKSIDDTPSLGGAGNTVVQNWLDIEGDRGLSAFDVRHQFQSGFVWTSPVAAPGSRIAADTKLGRL
ncbi:MAG: TonB-dependent receptor, partial [Acidobacteriaceae bacterium]|nr:TonB-dependent receptor [Acidobacteriaceae bacterium]